MSMQPSLISNKQRNACQYKRGSKLALQSRTTLTTLTSHSLPSEVIPTSHRDATARIVASVNVYINNW